jgi:hypothetical protein
MLCQWMIPQPLKGISIKKIYLLYEYMNCPSPHYKIYISGGYIIKKIDDFTVDYLREFEAKF